MRQFVLPWACGWEYPFVPGISVSIAGLMLMNQVHMASAVEGAKDGSLATLV